MYDCFYIFVMSFSLVYGFVRDPLAVLIVLSVQALIKVGIAAARRPASGRSLRQERQVGGACFKNIKWEELMPLAWISS